MDLNLVSSSQRISLDEISPERIREEMLKGVKLPEKASLFFRHLAHMGKLNDVIPELIEISPYWETLYSVLDRSPQTVRLLLLYWFLDRQADELDWYATHVFGKKSLETDHFEIELIALIKSGTESITEENSRSPSSRII